MSHRPPHPLQRLVHGFQIKLFCVKLPTGPTTEMAELLMTRLEDGPQKFLIAWLRADIVRWAPTFTGNADRLRWRSVRRQNLLQDDPMPPVVTEIVHVNHRVAFGQEHLGDRHPPFVDHVDIAIKSIIIGYSPILAVLLKLVKVAVGPVHDDLNCVVEAAKEERARHLDSPPDGRFDFEQGNLQFVDGRLGLGGGHKAYCRSKTGDGDAWVFWYYQFALSHIHRYPSIPNECRYCSTVGLLKEFKRAPPSPPTLVRSAGCEADGRKTEYLKWNTAHCRCPVNVVECRRTFQRSASRQSTNS